MNLPYSTAPNRVLNLAELQKPAYRRVLKFMDSLRERENISYLHPSKRWEYPWALERANLARASRVLDVGCGASIFPIYLAKQGHRVSAVDLQVPENLAAAHQVTVDYHATDMCRLPFSNDEFDAVFCISVIEHLRPAGMRQAMAEMRRVLKPGCNLYLTTDYYEDAAASLWYEGPGKRFAVDWSFFDAPQLRRYILEAPGWELSGELDLEVDWEKTKTQMRRFHGYPYTSVGVTLRRKEKP